jgi:hypothetical protein
MKIILYLLTISNLFLFTNNVLAVDTTMEEDQISPDETDYQSTAPIRSRSIASTKQDSEELNNQTPDVEKSAQDCYQKINQDDIDSCLENL